MIKLFSVLIIISSLLVNSNGLGQSEITNEQIWASRTFGSNSIQSVNSMKDGIHFSLLKNNKIAQYSYEDFGVPTAIIVDLNEINYAGKEIKAQDYFFNKDESKVLIATEVKSIYRRSFTANYFIIDIASKSIVELTDKGPQSLADFSPDGTKVAYVLQNNIYYYDINSKKTVQVTADGMKNEIINGATDWVYEEEFAITKGFYWSSNSQQIAFYRFDESKVKEFSMDYYLGKAYPYRYDFKYPKAGEDNSKLSVWVYDMSKDKSRMYLQSNSEYEYFPRIKWTNQNALCVLAMNRHQNKLDYLLVEDYLTAKYQGASSNQKKIYSDESETYVEVDDNLIFLEKEDAFLRTSEKDGFMHIYKINFDGSVKALTAGKWDVVELKGVDEEKGLVYYVSAEEGAMYKTLYSVGLNGKNKKKLSILKGSNNADFSTGMKYYINYYSNSNQPTLITLHNAKGKQLKVLEDNKELTAKLLKMKLPQQEFIKIMGETDSLNAYILKPKSFDATKKYPVYFHIYNGPGSNMVKDSWAGSTYMYHQLLASKGYIVISVDTRGTMYRGAKFKKSTYLQLGKYETEDMIAAAKSVGKWEYVDADRIGVMGWSYGGYMTALCMTKGADQFKMGISVAPVTNWRWYDNIYTERFMRTPQENAAGYDDNSPINHIEKLKGKFLIIHGGADDNVHVQNTMELVQKMVAANIAFDMAIYPNKNHGIYGGKTRLHLFNKILEYTLENL
ncbi:S9 family peptidase [Putridiphycobacter roseus]|uniref:S9 family peptidase n=1 Tax=Putridiphycobacter roseus TaxID=2219161 RepID=A0A2W1NSG3_9FLAO|nr:S9 family peptidase [Putridiphycobacter roseus]PZE17618.1 S9 family peptidase [Putridiphycobacter roseus]